MLYFCTLFDSFYLSRGLAMYESLKAHSSEFHLYIFAFDELSYKILLELKLQDITVISLNEFETPELLKVKKGRTKAEYCWTCTPSTISYVIKNINVPVCTYLDSDLFFYSDPLVLIEEMYNHHKNVLITEHRFSPIAKLYEEERAGRFCVQFITFTNEASSLEVLENWRIQCIDWCYARYENGKFGDQKYLNEWPIKYQNIHILEHIGGGIAPWNVQQYRFVKESNIIIGKIKHSGSVFKVVFFHFQYVKFLKNGSVDIGWYNISSIIKEMFYLNYLKTVQKIENSLHQSSVTYKTGHTIYTADSIKNFLKIGFKKIFGYNIMKLKQ